ncbi:MAG: hypothetical protein PHN74_01035 [Candidatus Pacebacteria bacterium]|nr:hypothetical protein [Candidatus Paceibacterota bacterium]
MIKRLVMGIRSKIIYTIKKIKLEGRLRKYNKLMNSAKSLEEHMKYGGLWYEALVDYCAHTDSTMYIYN